MIEIAKQPIQSGQLWPRLVVAEKGNYSELNDVLC